MAPRTRKNLCSPRRQRFLKIYHVKTRARVRLSAIPIQPKAESCDLRSIFARRGEFQHAQTVACVPGSSHSGRKMPA
ncbi:hypothetical protein [Lysobacter gummosus]|uniref:hypothetical protein n=1 Tax=Lysobacter gummosus TaxID=262324 RepID=UPI003644DB14